MPRIQHRPLHEECALAPGVGNQPVHDPDALACDFRVFEHCAIVERIPFERNDIGAREECPETLGIRSVHAADVKHDVGLQQPEQRVIGIFRFQDSRNIQFSSTACNADTATGNFGCDTLALSCNWSIAMISAGQRITVSATIDAGIKA